MTVTIRRERITNLIKLLIPYPQEDANKKRSVNVFSSTYIGPCNRPEKRDLNNSPEEINDFDGN